jgi:hypothetical protein
MAANRDRTLIRRFDFDLDKNLRKPESNLPYFFARILKDPSRLSQGMTRIETRVTAKYFELVLISANG